MHLRARRQAAAAARSGQRDGDSRSPRHRHDLTELAGHDMYALAIVALFTGMRPDRGTVSPCRSAGYGPARDRDRRAARATAGSSLSSTWRSAQASYRRCARVRTIEAGCWRPMLPTGHGGLVADVLGAPEITFQRLRHTHASQLLDAGVDIVTPSKRLGHASPGVTFGVYPHLQRPR